MGVVWMYPGPGMYTNPPYPDIAQHFPRQARRYLTVRLTQSHSHRWRRVCVSQNTASGSPSVPQPHRACCTQLSTPRRWTNQHDMMSMDVRILIEFSWCRSVSISRSVSIRVQNRISVNKCLEGEQNTTPRIINTTPKYLSIPKFCSKKRFRRGVVTFDPSGQKKTVYATFRALESCTTSTNQFAMNASEYCAGRRAFCCKECKKTLKIGVG